MALKCLVDLIASVEKQHRNGIKFCKPKPPAFKVEGTHIGIHVFEIQGREPKPTTSDRTASAVNLQKHLSAIVFADCGESLPLQGCLKGNTCAAGEHSSFFGLSELSNL